MRFHGIRVCAGVLTGLALTVAGASQAQVFPGGGIPGGGGGGGLGSGVQGQNVAGMRLLIKRRTVSGVVKAADAEKKVLTLAAGEGKEAKEVMIDVGPSRIVAGKGGATFADLKPGDKLKVYGEVMAQGGVRAMEITAPKERMSILPPEKPKKVKGEREVKPGEDEKPETKADEPKPEKKSKKSKKDKEKEADPTESGEKKDP